MSKNREKEKILQPLRKVTAGLLNLQMIETQTSSGVADVIGVNRKGRGFWLELKFLDNWPRRKTTAPFRDKFERGQLPFLAMWSDWHFPSYVLIKVEEEKLFYIIHPSLELKSYTMPDIQRDIIAVGDIKTIAKFLEHL